MTINGRITAIERAVGRPDEARAKAVRLIFLILTSGGECSAEEAQEEAERYVAANGPVTLERLLTESPAPVDGGRA